MFKILNYLIEDTKSGKQVVAHRNKNTAEKQSSRDSCDLSFAGYICLALVGFDRIGE